jgi:membrane-bound lytic murein transglycosylase D
MMSLAQALSSYLNINLLIVAGLLGLTLIRVLWPSLHPTQLLKLHYTILAAIVLLALVQPLLPHEQLFEPVAKIWSAPSMKEFGRASHEANGYMRLNQASVKSSLPAAQFAWMWTSLLILAVVIGGVRLVRDIRSLNRIRRHSFLMRRIGKLCVYIHPHISVPFSYWLPGSRNIVLPESLLATPEQFRIVVIHEIQHHRQLDTIFVFVMEFLRIVCVLNPVLHLWSHLLSEMQEFACDKTLVDRKKVKSQAYARCLVEVAQTAVHRESRPVCATGLVFLSDGKILKRRIQKMFTTTKSLSRVSLVALAGVLVAALSASALASKGLVQDRRITMSQAQEMAKRAQSKSVFPIVVNEAVLRQLNRFLGTPEGREIVKQVLKNMENYKPMLADIFAAYHAPEELWAVPFVESGYQNLPGHRNKTTRAAGLWQFIASTARAFGMRVDSQVDERLEERKETEAAMRYLFANKYKFNDWLLSLLAYNIGENFVQKGIDKTGSRDAWVLERAGFVNDTGYLAKVMAAVLIIKNPEWVE